MPRTLIPGTAEQDRSNGYVFPSRSKRVFWASLAFGVALLAVVVGLYKAGYRQTLTPGPLAEHHAKVDTQCVQCHQTGNALFTANAVADLRCERCHDPGQSLRMTHAAHEAIGGAGGPSVATHAESVPCVNCHRDHQGRDFAMERVGDRSCSTCHTSVKSFASHPQFAVVDTGMTAGVGITFNHDKHIAASPVAYDKVRAAGTKCDSCHTLAGDKRNFEPMTFARTCAGSSCHTSDPENRVLKGEITGLVDTEILRPENLPPSVVRSQPDISGSGELTVKRLVHADPWVLANVDRLRQAVDPEGELSERLAIETRLASLDQIKNLGRTNQIPQGDLDQAIAALQQDLDGLAQEIQSRQAPGSKVEIQSLLDAAQQLSQQLAGLAGESATPAVPNGRAGSASAPGNAPEPASDFDARVVELKALLKAIGERAAAASNTALRDRAAELSRRLDALKPAPSAPSSNTTALAPRVAELDRLIQAVSQVSGPAERAQLAQVDYLRRYAQQQITTGLTPTEFLAYQNQLTALLDKIEQRGDATIRARVDSLRQRVLALRPGLTGDALQRILRDRRRLLDRLVLERELKRDPGVTEPPSEQRFAADIAEATAQADRLRAQLARLAGAPRMSVPAAAEKRDNAAFALDTLLTPCKVCHVLDASQARIAPVQMDLSLVRRSIFNHKPHLPATAKCEDCHKSVLESKNSNTVDIPRVAECRTCHAPGKTKDTCVTCHLYHPPSSLQLIGMM